MTIKVRIGETFGRQVGDVTGMRHVEEFLGWLAKFPLFNFGDTFVLYGSVFCAVFYNKDNTISNM